MITLGIDTSNYTTSIALSDECGNVILDLRKPLVVGKNSIGLRQSDAFYQHVVNLNSMIETLKININSINRIVVSNQPRNIIDSYMPVFNAGVFFVNAINISNNFEIKLISHQEGHLLSGWDKKFNKFKYIYALHISGGTTELLKISCKNNRFISEITTQTLDISFGQLIDRIGVYMGFDFPSGEYIDSIAENYHKTSFNIAFKNNGFNISGIENKLKDIYNKTNSKELVSELLLSYLLEIIHYMVNKYVKDNPLLIIGGVGESDFLRTHVLNKNIYFAKKGYSQDNAVGLSNYYEIMGEICD